MSLSTKVVSLLLPAVLLAGCTNTAPSSASTSTPTSAGQTNTTTVAQANSYTTAQVSAHNTASNCWLIINNQVYDVTQFIPNHPGGDQIISGCGKDMTSYMSTMHKPVDNLLPQFKIGSLQP